MSEIARRAFPTAMRGGVGEGRRWRALQPIPPAHREAALPQEFAKVQR